MLAKATLNNDNNQVSLDAFFYNYSLTISRNNYNNWRFIKFIKKNKQIIQIDLSYSNLL